MINKMTASMFSVLCAVSLSAAVRTNVWDFSGTGGTVTNAADYFDAANWVGGAVGEGADVKVDFSGAQGLKFIKLNRDVAVYQMCGKDEAFTPDTVNRTLLVGDHTVTVSRYDNSCFAVQFYCDVYNGYSAAAYIQKSIFCGDYASADNGVWANTGTQAFRLDLYAKAPGENRAAGFMPDGTLRFSWGDIRVYAPQSSPVDVTGVYSQMAGSPYLFLKGEAHTLSAGTLVSGEGIPDGAFLKRIFPDGCIELSVPATQTIDGNTVTFAAFSPIVKHSIKLLQRSGGGSGLLKLMKSREEDVMRFEIASIIDHNVGVYTFDTDAGYVPGTFVIRPIDASKNSVALGTCHIEFAPPSSGSATPGFPNLTVRQVDSASQSRLSVTNGVCARIGGMTNLVGTVVKDGEGSLEFALGGRNSGSIVVREGVLELTGDALGENNGIGTLAVSNGATLKLPRQGVAAGAVAFEKGAVVSGGLLVVPSGTDISGAEFIDGAAVRFDGAGDLVVLEAPAGEVVGDPAFHIDVMKTESMTVETENGTNFVSRINDVRGPEYGFATNIVLRPHLLSDKNDGRPLLYIPYTSSDADPAKTPCLVWDKVIKGIKAAFVVIECGWDGSKRVSGGQFLGKTGRIAGGGGDFMRAAGFTEVFYRTSAARNGEFYINGARRNPDDGYLYEGHNQYGGFAFTPQVADVQFAGNGSGAADAFGCNNGAQSRNGAHRFCECIIYTNALTRLEQLRIRAYLTRKWVNAEVNIVQGPIGGNRIGNIDVSNGAATDVAENDEVWADKVSGSGEFRKSGSGTLYVGEIDGSVDAVKVAGGKLVLRSGVAPSDFHAQSAYVHLDASRPETLTLGDDGVSVKTWKSLSPLGVVAAGLSGMTNFPVYAKAEIGGVERPVVDFGPFMKIEDKVSPYTAKKATTMEFSVKTQLLHTVIAVIGSRNGGNALVGCSGAGYNDNWGLTRGGTFGQSEDDAILRNDGWHAFFAKADATEVRMNGEPSTSSAGLSGGFDLVTVNSYRAFGARGLAGSHYNYYTGGQEIGEYLIWPRRLSDERVKMAEAYLKKKWFGEETPGFRWAAATQLDVAAGAELQIIGDRLTVGKLSGGGKVSGNLEFSGTAEIEVRVNADGSIDPIEIDGEFDWSKGGILRVSGDVGKLAEGGYRAVLSDSIMQGAVSGWECAAEGDSRYIFTLRATGGVLELAVSRRGTTLIVR